MQVFFKHHQHPASVVNGGQRIVEDGRRHEQMEGLANGELSRNAVPRTMNRISGLSKSFLNMPAMSPTAWIPGDFLNRTLKPSSKSAQQRRRQFFKADVAGNIHVMLFDTMFFLKLDENGDQKFGGVGFNHVNGAPAPASAPDTFPRTARPFQRDVAEDITGDDVIKRVVGKWQLIAAA